MTSWASKDDRPLLPFLDQNHLLLQLKPIHRSVQYIFSSWRLGHECDITPGKALSGSLAFLRPGRAGGSAPSCPCHYEQIPQATWLGPLRQPPVSWCLGPKICKSCSSWFHFPPPYQIDKGCRPQFFFKIVQKAVAPRRFEQVAIFGRTLQKACNRLM